LGSLRAGRFALASVRPGSGGICSEPVGILSRPGELAVGHPSRAAFHLRESALGLRDLALGFRAPLVRAVPGPFRELVPSEYSQAPGVFLHQWLAGFGSRLECLTFRSV
jgi:hypothetical protein